MSKKSRAAKAAAAAQTATPGATPAIQAEKAIVNADKKAKRQDAENKKAIVKKITNEKDLIYHYPADCNTLADRKKFRAEARRKRTAYLAKFKKVEDKKEKRSIGTEYNEWAKAIFVTPELVKLKEAAPVAE